MLFSLSTFIQEKNIGKLGFTLLYLMTKAFWTVVFIQTKSGSSKKGQNICVNILTYLGHKTFHLTFISV